MTLCKICSNTVEKIISFGKMPIANGFLMPSDYMHEYYFELAAGFCKNCKMLQLIEQPDPKMMFHENYAFFSSTSKSMAEHFEKMALHYLNEFIPDPKNSFVIELGSNDGIMLRHIAKAGINHLGIEPSQNVAAVAMQNGVHTISEFFGKETAQKIEKAYGKADIISAANVMCHIPDLSSVGKGVDILLKEKGIFVFEDPYLGDMIHKTSYDQIYDEHVYIFSVQSITNAFSPFDLEIFHVEHQETHGGSMRYYLCRKGAYSIRSSVQKQLKYEEDLGLHKIETYQHFAKECETSKNLLLEKLTQIRAAGKRIVGYAATSKSTTVLNYCGTGPDLIEYICDTTPLKQGKFSPGMHIPIKSYEDFKKDQPDYIVLFAWNHAKEIFAKEQDFIKNKEQWIVLHEKKQGV